SPGVDCAGDEEASWPRPLAGSKPRTTNRTGRSRTFVIREKAVQGAFDVISLMTQASLSFRGVRHRTFRVFSSGLRCRKWAVRDDDSRCSEYLFSPENPSG